MDKKDVDEKDMDEKLIKWNDIFEELLINAKSARVNDGFLSSFSKTACLMLTLLPFLQ